MRLAPVAASLVLLAAFATSSRAQAQSTLIPLTTRRDMVFDYSGQYLYITTSDGWVRRYNLSTNQVEPGYQLGGSPYGMDIAPDGSFLLVAQNTVSNGQGTVHRIDLATGTVTNINYSLYSNDGAWDVAIASNGRALFTASYPGSGGTPLRQIDLATNTVTRRLDAPSNSSSGVYFCTQVHRSESGNRLYIVEGGLPGAFVYDAATNAFGPAARCRAFSVPPLAGISRDGSILATRRDDYATLDSSSDFSFQHSYSDLNSGVAFDAGSDTFYAVNTATDQIVAYDTTSKVEKFRLTIGEDVLPTERWGYGPNAGQFTSGVLVASKDGRFLALETASGIRLIRVSPESQIGVPPPVFEKPRDMIFDRAGQYLYLTTATGLAWPFNLSSQSLEPPYSLGGSLNAVDIAPDDSYLLIAQANLGLGGYGRGIVHKLDLRTGAITQISYLNENYSSENGSWDLAIAANGTALLTTILGIDGYSGWTPLRQIDLATNVVFVRTDAPGSSSSHQVTGNTVIDRSADRSRLLLREPNIDSGPVFSYSATSNTFGPVGHYYGFHEHVNSAVNRDGSALSLRYRDNNSFFLLPDLGFTHEWFGLDSGIAFDAVDDLFYAVKSSTDQIIAYDSNSYGERFRIPIGENVPATPPTQQNPGQPFGDAQFSVGTLVASQDGHYLALITPTGVRVIDTGTRSSTLIPLGATSYLLGPPRPGNVSTRVAVRSNDEVPIAGFIVTGSSPKTVVIRAMGPSLLSAGVSGAITDPTLELHDSSGGAIAFNDNWAESQAAEIEGTGLAPADSRESAIVRTLSPGAYTAVMQGKNGETGIGLVEVYDADPASASILANLSTRAWVGTDSSVMIAGVIIKRGGNGSGTERILVRALGPSLAQVQVPNPVQDPSLALFDGNGSGITSNTDWQDTQQAEIQSTGLAPSNPREAALLVELAPGNYTALLTGNPVPGVGLVEVYALP